MRIKRYLITDREIRVLGEASNFEEAKHLLKELDGYMIFDTKRSQIKMLNVDKINQIREQMKAEALNEDSYVD